MFQEISRREKLSGTWLSFWIIAAAAVLIMVNTLLVKFHANSGLTDFMIIALSAGGLTALIKKNLVYYKYCIIDDEFMVHEVVGTKEKRILNFNVAQITTFENVQSDSYEQDKRGKYTSKKRLYNCSNKSNRHYVVFEEDHALRWFTFQPSDQLIELLQHKIQG